MCDAFVQSGGETLLCSVGRVEHMSIWAPVGTQRHTPTHT